jgi:hypothetical protein
VTHVEIVATDLLHIRELCENMRDVERANFAALGWEPERTLTHEVATSLVSYAGLVDGEVIAVWGARCAGIFDEEAYVWIVFTRRLERIPVTVLRHSREALSILRQSFKVLHGLVLSDFDCGCRWLEWLGFTVSEPEGPVRKFRIG